MRAPEADPGSLSVAAHLGFEGSTGRHRMALRPMASDAWLEPDANREWQLAEKARLLAEDRARYVLDPMTPVADAAATQLAERLAEHLAAEMGASLVDGASAIERCGRSTQEDWCLMIREDTWRLRAACLCFPSRWVLAEKAGGTIAEIHAPVPRYDTELGGLVESFSDRLRRDRSMWRTNWNLWDDPRLSQPFTEADSVRFDPPSADEVGERAFLRVERQGLHRLADDAIAFTIRVHQRPIAWLVDQPGAIDALRSALTGGGAASLAEKKLGHLGPAILTWLASH